MKFSNLIALTLISFAPVAFSQGAPADRKEAAALHRTMSDLHKEVAVCLDSERPVTECQQIMAGQCSAMMGKGGRGMRGGMMRGGMGMMGCPLNEDAPEKK